MVIPMKPLLTSVVLILALTGCATKPSSLYDQLGGKDNIAQAVDYFIDGIAFDPQIYPYFAETNIERFRNKMIEQLCFEAGGPCEYSGDSMEQVHAGMNVNEADFNRLVDLLVDAMTKAGISHRAQNQLLAKLAPMRRDIIYK